MLVAAVAVVLMIVLGVALVVVAAKPMDVVLAMGREAVVLVMVVVVSFKENPLPKPVPVAVGRDVAVAAVGGALNPRLRLPLNGVVVDRKLGVAEVAGTEELTIDAKSKGAFDVMEAAADAAVVAGVGATVSVGLTPSMKPDG